MAQQHNDDPEKSFVKVWFGGMIGGGIGGIGGIGGVLFAMLSPEATNIAESAIGLFFIGSVAGGAVGGTAIGVKFSAPDGRICGALGGGFLGIVAGPTSLGLPFVVQAYAHNILWSIGGHSWVITIESSKRGDWKDLTPSDLYIFEAMPKSEWVFRDATRIQIDDPPRSGIPSYLATALLAKQNAGNMQLELGSNVVKMTGLVYLPTWPDGSLESELFWQGNVYEVVKTWIGTASDDPRGNAVSRIITSIQNRRLLDVMIEKKRVLKLFRISKTRRSLSDRVSSQVKGRPIRLLEQYQLRHPELHGQLMNDIEKAFADQTVESG